MPKIYSLTLLAAAFVGAWSPAMARPQWMPISADEDSFLDYNSIRGSGITRSGTVSFPSEGGDGMQAHTMHVNCRSWMYAFTLVDHNRDYTSKWMPIGKGTTAETAAEIMCPK